MSKKSANGSIVVPKGNGMGAMAPAPKGLKADQPSSTPAKQTVGFQVANPASSQLPEDSDRLLFALCAAMGSQAELQVKGGEKQEGILIAADKKGKDLSVLLGAVKPVKSGPPNERQQSPPKPWVSKIFFQGQDVVKIVARDVDLRGTKAEASNSKAAAGFGTDADISRGRREELFGRELQKWEPAEEDGDLLTLDDGPKAGKAGRWDQFEANRRQFGVRTSFNEDMYTTKLDKSRAKISEREATMIAAEIEGKKTTNLHLAEERRQIDYREADEDEEARYAAVDRGAGHAGTSDNVDSRNDDTFGPASSKENGSAWSNAASSMAAVAGGPPASQASAPIDVDPRREHNKVRMQLAGKPSSGSRERSPYGTPKSGRSPLESPLVGNASQLTALDLNPGTAKFDPNVRAEFAKYKRANKLDSISPSTESELAKAASAAASLPSGSAASTPEDRTLSNSAAASDTGPSTAPSAQLPTASAVRTGSGQGPPSRPTGPLRRGPNLNDQPHNMQQAGMKQGNMPHGMMPHSSGTGQSGGPMMQHGPPHGARPMPHGGWPPPQGSMPPPHAAGPMQHRVPVMTVPLQMRPGPRMPMQRNPRPAPQGRPPSISFGAHVPGMQQMHGMPAHNGASTTGVPIHMPHSGPGQQQPTPPRGQLPPQGASSAASTPAPSRPATAASTKLNPNAKEFKFNPSASSFIPASSASSLSRAASNASSALQSAASTSTGVPSTSGSGALGQKAQPLRTNPAASRARPNAAAGRGGGQQRPAGPGGRPGTSLSIDRRPSRELPPGGRQQPRSPSQGPRFEGRQVQSARPTLMQPQFPRPASMQEPVVMSSQVMSPPQMGQPGMPPHTGQPGMGQPGIGGPQHMAQFQMAPPGQRFMQAPQGYMSMPMQPGTPQMAAYMSSRPFSPGGMQGQHPQMMQYVPMAMSPPGNGPQGQPVPMYPQQPYAMQMYPGGQMGPMPMNMPPMNAVPPQNSGGDRPVSGGRPG